MPKKAMPNRVISNAAAKDAIRPFTPGHKNRLFADTPNGARASAIFYSLIESAKANGLEPVEYLKHILKELPYAVTVEKLEALLPWNVKVSGVLSHTTSRLPLPEAERVDPTASQKRNRKRNMAGYQVEQTTTGTGTFPRHQQQPEQGTIPPIKLRRVTDNNRSVVGSSTAEQITPEALKGESAMFAYAANRPGTVISPISRNLPTASDNSTLLPIISQLRYRPYLNQWKGESVTTVTNRDNLILKFSANHQSDLRAHLTNPKIQAVLDKAEVLMETLNDRHIQLSLDRGKPPAHSIISRLKSLKIVNESPVFSGYFTNAREFFLYVNTQQITNTSCLTSMFKSKAHIKNFAKESQENVQVVAGNPCLKQISSMCNGKGLPKKANIKAFVHWLPSDERKNFLKLACRIFAGFGVPSGATLAEHSETLCQRLKEYGYSTDNGDDSTDADDYLPEASQLKVLALFCSAPAKWQMKIAEFEQYLDAHKSARNERVAVCAALKSLQPILAIHGGPGIRCWLEKHHEYPRSKAALTKALSIPAPLAITKFVLTFLSESESQAYIRLCRNLKPAPTRAQWGALKPLRQQLDQRFEYTLSKRMMLEILWPQSGDNRSKYASGLDDLIKTVPTISQWHRLHRALGPQKMQDFMDACLAWQNSHGTAPEVTVHECLLEGLLLANHYLPEHTDIPDLCFSKRVSSADKSCLFITKFRNSALLPGFDSVAILRPLVNEDSKF